MKRFDLYATLWLMAILMTCPIFGADVVPKLINYQGKLTDATGIALADGEYSVTFQLFDAATGGNLVWGETRTVILVSGVFNVALGGAGSQPVPGAAVNDIGFAFGDAERYLETAIVSGPSGAVGQTLMPRQQMASVPYSMKAARAGNGVSAGAIVAYAGAVSPEGWILCDGMSYDGTEEVFRNLFAAIGKTYGSGNGDASSFNVPDLRGRVVGGAGNGPGLTHREPGQAYGSETMTLLVANLPDHKHGISLTTSGSGAHSHSIPKTAGSFPGNNNPSVTQSSGSSGAFSTSGVGDHSHSVTGNSREDEQDGGGAILNQMKSTPFAVTQPTLSMHYIIKL